jgi:hypothetical protein
MNFTVWFRGAVLSFKWITSQVLKMMLHAKLLPRMFKKGHNSVKIHTRVMRLDLSVWFRRNVWSLEWIPPLKIHVNAACKTLTKLFLLKFKKDHILSRVAFVCVKFQLVPFSRLGGPNLQEKNLIDTDAMWVVHYYISSNSHDIFIVCTG